MRYLVDSNVLIYAASGAPLVIAFLDKAVTAEWIGYSAISRLEVFGYPNLQPDDATKLDRLLQCFSEVDINRAVINRAITVRQSNPIKAPDAIVAATALLMNAHLVTRNTADFRHVSELELVNPFEPGR